MRIWPEVSPPSLILAQASYYVRPKSYYKKGDGLSQGVLFPESDDDSATQNASRSGCGTNASSRLWRTVGSGKTGSSNANQRGHQNGTLNLRGGWV